MKKAIISIWNFYYEGFKNMTWGRSLWVLIFLKVIILKTGLMNKLGLRK